MFRPVVFRVKDTHEAILDKHKNGMKEDEAHSQRTRYGSCELNVPRKSIPALLVDEVLNPFYIFQVFSMCLWFWDGYEKYAYCILAISLAGVLENLYETVHNINQIRRLAKFYCAVEVKRQRDPAGQPEIYEVSSSDLVPGDIIVVPENNLMPCDVVLLSGSAIVNEAMLTGESVPVIKNSLQRTHDIYDPNQYDTAKKYTLYSGTKVIQTRNLGD